MSTQILRKKSNVSLLRDVGPLERMLAEADDARIR